MLTGFDDVLIFIHESDIKSMLSLIKNTNSNHFRNILAPFNISIVGTNIKQINKIIYDIINYYLITYKLRDT